MGKLSIIIGRANPTNDPAKERCSCLRSGDGASSRDHDVERQVVVVKKRREELTSPPLLLLLLGRDSRATGSSVVVTPEADGAIVARVALVLLDVSTASGFRLSIERETFHEISSVARRRRASETSNFDDSSLAEALSVFEDDEDRFRLQEVATSSSRAFETVGREIASSLDLPEDNGDDDDTAIGGVAGGTAAALRCLDVRMFTGETVASSKVDNDVADSNDATIDLASKKIATTRLLRIDGAIATATEIPGIRRIVRGKTRGGTSKPIDVDSEEGGRATSGGTRSSGSVVRGYDRINGETEAIRSKRDFRTFRDEGNVERKVDELLRARISSLETPDDARGAEKRRDDDNRNRSHFDPKRHLALLLCLLAMGFLCGSTVAVPMPDTSALSLAFGQHRRLATVLEDDLQLAYEDSFARSGKEDRPEVPGGPGEVSKILLGEEEEIEETITDDRFENNDLDDDELEIIRRSIVSSLGLRRMPDPSKANVSQAEYERAHREYLNRVQLSQHGQELKKRRNLHIFHAAEHPGNRTRRDADVATIQRRELFFPVEIPIEDGTVDHASLRLFLEGYHHRHHYHHRHNQPRYQHHPPRHRDRRQDDGHDIEVLLYLRTPDSRRLIVRERFRLEDQRDSRWLELDATEAVFAWLDAERENLGLELEFLLDGETTMSRDYSSPTLNVFTLSTATDDDVGVVGPGGGSGGFGRRKRAAPEQLMSLHKGRRTECRGDNKKCCRHEMTVNFKDLKGFEFIVQPKIFDAGYCKGRCPPRYNPAHHHALLQSLIWKEDRRKAPRPCCAPSKLAELDIVYFDENNSTRLKVSKWKNMRVLECACS